MRLEKVDLKWAAEVRGLVGPHCPYPDDIRWRFVDRMVGKGRPAPAAGSRPGLPLCTPMSGKVRSWAGTVTALGAGRQRAVFGIKPHAPEIVCHSPHEQVLEHWRREHGDQAEVVDQKLRDHHAGVLPDRHEFLPSHDGRVEIRH